MTAAAFLEENVLKGGVSGGSRVVVVMVVEIAGKGMRMTFKRMNVVM